MNYSCEPCWGHGLDPATLGCGTNDHVMPHWRKAVAQYHIYMQICLIGIGPVPLKRLGENMPWRLIKCPQTIWWSRFLRTSQSHQVTIQLWGSLSPRFYSDERSPAMVSTSFNGDAGAALPRKDFVDVVLHRGQRNMPGDLQWL